jgi:hypothetical protein
MTAPPEAERYLADTNLFIQCKALEELTWGDLSAATLIELYPAPTAIAEIDKHKGDNAQRRAKRARAMSGVFKQVLANGEVVIREKNPRVLLKFAPPLDDGARARIAAFPDPDQRIVEEAAALVAVLPGLRVLSHDTGTLLRAQTRAVPATIIPDSWLAPPEPSSLERDLAAVRRELAALRDAAPKLAMRIIEADGDNPLVLERVTFAPLDEAEVSAAVALITAEDHVYLSELADAARKRTISANWFPPTLITEEQVERRRAAVSAWEGELAQTIGELHGTATIAHVLAPVTLAIANEGAAPAEGLRVRITGEGELRLAAEEASELLWGVSADNLSSARAAGVPLFRIKMPELRKRRPSPFDPDYLSRAFRTPAFDIPPVRFARDRYAFDRTSDDDDKLFASEIVFECDDFRHGVGETMLTFGVLIPPAAGSSALKIELSTKIGEPVRRTVRVEYSVVERAFSAIAQRMIEDAKAALEREDDD